MLEILVQRIGGHGRVIGSLSKRDDAHHKITLMIGCTALPFILGRPNQMTLLLRVDEFRSWICVEVYRIYISLWLAKKIFLSYRYWLIDFRFYWLINFFFPVTAFSCSNSFGVLATWSTLFAWFSCSRSLFCLRDFPCRDLCLSATRVVFWVRFSTWRHPTPC